MRNHTTHHDTYHHHSRVVPPAPPPPESPTLNSPWRSWGNNYKDLQFVKDFQPQNTKVKHVRVLLYGPVGAGKSSFISSVSSTLRGRIHIPALACATTSDQGFTKKYQTHKIKKEVAGKYYPFVFNDIMGLEEGTGVRVEDVKLALMGHVKEGYTLNPVSSLSPSDIHYIPKPSPEDRVHVLVCVCSANAAEIKDSVLQKMKKIREAASDFGIPQLAIVTKIDEACGETEKDLKNVYLSKHVKNKMANFSSKLGIPLNCILPVKNYSQEINTNEDTDTLILNALKLMIDFGDDFTNRFVAPAPPLPESPTLKSPWRPWGNNNKDLQSVKDFQPQNTKVKHVRVLLYGPVGAGKSSFISSVSSTLRGRIATPALASATTSDQSFTKKYQTHKIPKEVRGKYYPFAFNDIMGLEEGTGVRVEDVKLALMGHVKEGYTFNPVSSLSPSDSHYIPKPSPEDRVHVLVCVCSANAAEIKDSVLQKMKTIREAASDFGIPQLAIVTKIDEACGETEKDLKNVYLSKHVKNKMADFSSKLGIPLNCILPVKNYSQETNTNKDVDTLILSALKMMIDFGDDFMDSLCHGPESGGSMVRFHLFFVLVFCGLFMVLSFVFHPS